ncbi:putative Rhodanese-like domain, serine hydrolase FSH, Zinc finger, FYVE/PHD-type, rhodanase [Helianthus annuus]|uniref:Rhodanese-like domain, serine hydrolase FSH, Zinc finger, FYVE/PHD-type, rhodanase n=2 Tax=Helianthus annuus TaxID=4232 RepID=A0A9K3HNR5_HELAN|nr:rhodanese-like domain-containing protein 6 [Helianthus annuus]KAF5781622.1 putative Rhodanese-like domain, serine hydrolase FSH, Zinc finger, FYVE/PHD-type, rhodanase [Helianthus annuus]
MIIVAESMTDKKSTDDDKYGVLLYYKYTKIPDLDDLFTTYTSNCTALSLLGRVRLAPDGVNVTIGGKLSSLNEHIAFMSKNQLFDGTDFKLATCSEPINDKIADECGFTTLSIRIVKELVTFSSHPLLKPPEISNAGQHLSAIEFHSLLQNANASETSRKLVLLDARNLYETRIGKFNAPNVETLDPEIRQYSDLPSWLDNQSEKLRGNNILMYCTGGIRCEMASAYIKSKGPGFENVFQLYGGIQRYMEQFPDGGFFKGKNFVFDHRVSVGPSDNVVGNCLVCNFPFDDYSSRSRCRYCRMLVLVCHACKGMNPSYVCELCQKYGKLDEPEPESEAKPEPALKGSKKLRILCLHGFRQNASSFKGRTASLAKKLKNMVEFVYIDAPHQLQFIYQNQETGEAKFPPNKVCNRKFAWFIDPSADKNTSLNWEMAQTPFDSLQYQKQTAGYDESLTYLKEFVTKNGPFDGILGFSQGAAMAACVAAQKSSLKGEIDFRFVILCSGFQVNLVENEKNLINCPSLHIYGSDHGKDTQIAFDASKRLGSLFEEGSAVIIEHDYGHIIPTRSPYIDMIKDFLERFH